MSIIFCCLLDEMYPSKKLKELGVSWAKAICNPATDSAVFFGCANVPESLPKGMTLSDKKPRDYMFRGLNEAEVIALEQGGDK